MAEKYRLILMWLGVIGAALLYIVLIDFAR
jgi:hypothetical protein